MEAVAKGLDWPFFSFLFGIIFLLLFRKPLNSLISRITSINKSGIETLQTPEAQKEKLQKDTVQQLLLEIGNSIVLEDVEGRIKADLKEKGLDIDGDTIKLLTKRLAATVLLLEFEQIHNLIFGSQIFLLKKLNEVRGQGRSSEFIAAHFQHLQGFFPKELGHLVTGSIPCFSPKPFTNPY